MKTQTFVRAIVVVFLWLSFLTFTNIAYSEVNESDINDAVIPYPRVEVVDQFNGAVEDYSIALGEMKKVRDIWGPEREKRLSGQLHRITMQIPEGHRQSEVFEFYQRKMRNLNARILFECEARGCGSSNAWANAHFEDKLLYGLDDQQTYGVYEVVDDKGLLNYVSVYTVARGNRRVYAHTEWLRTNSSSEAAVAPSAEEVSDNLREQGYYVLRGISLQNETVTIDDEHFQAIVSAIRTNRRLNIRIVGHSYGKGSLEQQQQLSENYAKQVYSLLVEAGIPAQRLSYFGVGSLAPAGQALADQRLEMRIELVVGDA